MSGAPSSRCHIDGELAKWGNAECCWGLRPEGVLHHSSLNVTHVESMECFRSTWIQFGMWKGVTVSRSSQMDLLRFPAVPVTTVCKMVDASQQTLMCAFVYCKQSGSTPHPSVILHIPPLR